MNFREALEAEIKENPEHCTSWLIDDLDLDGVEEVENEILDTGRWHSHHRAVYRHEGRFWAVEYSEGLTEYQESDSYDTTVYEVVPYEVTVTHYRAL